jgi:IS30 family transposase
MGMKNDISIEEKARAVSWKQEGVTTTEIAARLSRHPPLE